MKCYPVNPEDIHIIMQILQHSLEDVEVFEVQTNRTFYYVCVEPGEDQKEELIKRNRMNAVSLYEQGNNTHIPQRDSIKWWSGPAFFDQITNKEWN